ncbi:MAG: VirB4-like conjugal transfer ATPase, CD1110 family [Acetatifactor sp.]
MGLFTDGFKELKKAGEPLYKVPKSIQETIEIMKVAENGIFEVAKNRFSKCYRFQDINYTTTNEIEQIDIFERYCRFLNSLDVSFKITINNKNKDMEQVRDRVFLQDRNDGFDHFRKAYNDIMEKKIHEGRQGIEQERYLTITIERKNFEEAKAQFATIEASVHKAFNELGADIIPLSGNERMKVLHDFYHLGEENSFDFAIRAVRKVGVDFRNDLCNKMVQFYPDYFKDEKKFCRALFIKKYPSSLSDRFLNEITSLPVHSITSIDVVPIPKDMTTKVLQKKYLGIESDIIKQQRVRNKDNDFSSEISYNKRIEKKEIEEIMDDVRENDQCLYYVAVTIILMAESKEELDSMTEMVETIGKRNSVTIEEHYLKQREALNTALPIGVRQVETMRTMLTQSLAVLMPFNVQELNDRSGCYYGINQVSKNINIGNRKRLINGNGFVFGVPGSGKSHFCKMELGQVFLAGEDEIIIIDPMNEYFDIARTYGGTVVNMSTYTDNYVNPLDMDVWSLDLNDSKGMIREKGEFMLGLCEQCMGESLNSRQKSIIDRCVRKLYIEIARNREKYVPVMSDFYDILMNQPEEEAKDIALSLELFVNGSLNIFNHQTNVDVDNRFTVYGIRDLGTELSPITMLVMMESIQNRIIQNGKRGVATWLYIDEFHVLLNSEYSARYLQQLWKKVRKQGRLCTGITQNVVDLLQNYTATTMLANSEFVALLKQANTDSSQMAEVIGVSEAQLRFVTNTRSGMGLMKCGNVVIPFDNTIEKGTDLYNLYNTNIHEKIALEKRKNAVDNGESAC